MNYITEYYDKIEDGSIVVGELIRTLYEMITTGLKSGKYIYRARRAELAISYIEAFCHHHEGKLAPGLLHLELWQKAFIALIFGIYDHEGYRQFTEVFLVMGRKNGKAVSLDTEIATPDGWKLMRDIKEGDFVFAQDGQPSRVEYVSPVFHKPMYKVTFEDGETVKASADHLWTVRTKNSMRAHKRGTNVKNTWMVKEKYHENEGWYDVTTQSMYADFAHVRHDGKGTEHKYHVPMAKPVEYAERMLPIDPYTLGVWLGDGSKGSTEITVSDADLEELKAHLEQEGHAITIKHKKDRASMLALDITPRGKPNKLRDALKALNVLGNKHIPEQYLQASIQQRLALLQGLMDTDGYCSKAGQCEFAQKDEGITNQVRELLASLGIKSSKTKKAIWCNGKECYAFSVKFFVDKSMPCFRMKRKLERLKPHLSNRMKAKSIINIEPIEYEPSKCIMVDNPSHLYLVGRSYTATHNTLLASAICSYMYFADGEYGGQIYFAAPKLAQANLCFNAFHRSIEYEPELKAAVKKRRLDIYCKSTNTVAMPVAFNSKTSDGFNPSMVVADEIAAWQGDRGLKQYEVYMSAYGARENPLMLSITTAGYETGGIYDELMGRATRILKGGSTEEHFLPVLYIIDDESKWDDIGELKKSNPNLGVSIMKRSLQTQIDVAHNSLSKQIEFKTKVCNIPQNSRAAWLSASAIRDCMGDQLRLEDFTETYCVGGVDLSQSVDLTAACVLIERDKELYCFAHFWLPGAKLAECMERDKLPYDQYIQRGIVSLSGENNIDYEDCYSWFCALVEQYHIYPLWVGYDRYCALQFSKTMSAYGFHMDSVYQGTNLTGIINETEGTINDRRLHIGDNDLLAVHLLNATLHTETASNRKKLAKPGKGKHIDGAACILDAMTMRQTKFDEIGLQLMNLRGDD